MPDSPSQNVLIECGGEHVSVRVDFRDRKRLSISVHPDRSVTAVAPADRSIEDVLTYLRRHRSWIARQRRHIELYQPLPEEKRYVSGETHLYLGHQYRLRIRRSEEATVKLVGRFFNVGMPKPKQPRAVADALAAWYRSHADRILCNRLSRCREAITSLRSKNVRFRIGLMRGRWGSCSKAGTITLNADLVKAPVHCIDYVIMHELCHLIVHDHSPAFFRLLGRCMPDWKIRKERLDSVVLR